MIAPTLVAGRRVVRIRPRSFDIGLGHRIQMWIVTNPGDRRMIGHTHLSRRAAAEWVTAQAWIYVGSQEADR